ncbi:MAG: hypothetical protein ACOCUV_00010 [bacterium]
MELLELKNISQEVNEKLGLIPKINNTEKREELIKQLKVLNDFNFLDKYLSEEAMKVIRSLKM